MVWYGMVYVECYHIVLLCGTCSSWCVCVCSLCWLCAYSPLGGVCVSELVCVSLSTYKYYMHTSSWWYLQTLRVLRDTVGS